MFTYKQVVPKISTCFTLSFALLLSGNVFADSESPVDKNARVLAKVSKQGNIINIANELKDIETVTVQNSVSNSVSNSVLNLTAIDTDHFNPYISIPVGSWPEAVAMGDVNGDGLTDVVMTTGYYFDPENDYKLFVFLQTATGELATPIKYSTNSEYTDRPYSLAVGDLNGDGLHDVAVGLDRSAVLVYLQGANGQLSSGTHYATSYSTQITIADLNNDGLNDVAGIGHSGSNAGVLYQNTSGELNAPIEYYAPHGGFNDIETGDVNNDGLTDLVVMSGQGYAYDNLQVLTQNTTGFDAVVAYDLDIDVNASSLAIADLNNDGLDDVAITHGGNRPNSMLSVFAQEETGTLAVPTSMTSYDIPDSLQAKDINLDGLDDLIVLHNGWNKMGVYIQGPDGQLSTETLYPIPYASSYDPDGLAVGDINNDGTPDAAIADYNNGLVLLYGKTIINTLPQLNLLSPQNGDSFMFNELVVFNATASDSEDGDISANIQWVSSIDGLLGTGSGFSANLSEGTHLITTSVTDSQNGSISQTLTLVVMPNNPPEVSITSIHDGIIFNEGDLVNLQASATDPEEGDLSSSIVWSSSIAGQLGSGSSIDVNLTSGSHTITATVVDGQNEQSTQSVNIIINALPQLNLLSPQNGDSFMLNESIVFNATASDSEDGVISANIQWVSSIDGSLGTGSGFNANLSLGTHIITTTVTDSNGSQATQNAEILITEIIASASVSGKGKRKTTTISWSGAINSVDIYLNNSIVANGAISGSIDFRYKKRSVYKVCESGTNYCSAELAPR